MNLEAITEKHFGFKNFAKQFEFGALKDIKEEKSVINNDECKFEIGKVYTLEFLGVMVPFSKKKCSIEFSLSRAKDDNLKGKMTLVKYLGDGFFQEYFTEQIIKLEDGSEKTFDFDETVKYYQMMMGFIENPLCISEVSIGSVGTLIPDKFIKSKNERIDFCANVDKLVEDIRGELTEFLNTLINEDFNMAYIDNCIFEFERGNSYVKKKTNCVGNKK